MTRIMGLPANMLIMGVIVWKFAGMSTLLRVVAPLALLGVIVLVFYQERLFYSNNEDSLLSKKPPKDSCPRCEEIHELRTEDGVNLHACFFPAPDRWTLKTAVFNVQVKKDGQHLGLDLGVLKDSGGRELVVNKVLKEGRIPESNHAKPSDSTERVAEGDLVLEVNGIRGDGHKQMKEMKEADILDVTFQRVYEEKRPTVLYLQGYDCNLNLAVRYHISLTEKLGVNVLALDYRGYGSSKGKPSEEGIIEDCLCAWRWLRKRGDVDESKIFVSGVDLGGAAAVALVSQLQQEQGALPQGLILEDPLISAGALVDDLIPRIVRLCVSFAVRIIKILFLRIHWKTEPRIKDMNIPMLFISGGKYKWRVTRRRVDGLRTCAQAAPWKGSLHMEDFGATSWKAQEKFINECLTGESSDASAEKATEAAPCVD